MKLDFIEILEHEGIEKLNFGNEPDNLFVSYFKEGNWLKNKSTVLEMGNLFDIELKTEHNRITSSSISDFGIKTFPQFGAYGFYTPLYGNGSSKIIAPINPKSTREEQPNFKLIQNASETTILITQPNNLNYDCFRITFRYGNFTYDFITYDLEVTIPTLPNGLYNVYLLGYTEDGRYSIETEPFNLTVPSTIVLSDWFESGRATDYAINDMVIWEYTWYKCLAATKKMPKEEPSSWQIVL